MYHLLSIIWLAQYSITESFSKLSFFRLFTLLLHLSNISNRKTSEMITMYSVICNSVRKHIAQWKYNCLKQLCVWNEQSFMNLLNIFYMCVIWYMHTCVWNWCATCVLFVCLDGPLFFFVVIVRWKNNPF